MSDPAIYPPASADAWHTLQGTIRKGMKVIAADGTCIGTVSTLEGEELMLEGGAHDFVAITQIDGVSAEAVLLSDRGDTTFGMGGEP